MADLSEMHKLFAELIKILSNEFKELKDFHQETERDIRTIMQQTADLNQKLDVTTTRVDQLEARLSDLDDAEADNQKTMKWVKSRIDELAEQMDYLENKLRQNNLCIYNVAEKSEGSDIMAFLDQLIGKELLGELNIIHAHRTYHERKNSVRPIIVAFLNNSIKRRVLQAAWAKKEVMLKDTQIYFDHHFTFNVRQQRSLYKPIRVQLKAQDIKTHILVPAKLKVFNDDGTTTIFPTPAAAIKDQEEKVLY